MNSLLQPTADGSLTLWDEETSQHYHNRAGAYTESLENYVYPSGLERLFQDVSGKIKPSIHLNMLDACFGLGYNTFSLIKTVLEHPQQPTGTLLIDAIELNPKLLPFWSEILSFHEYKSLQSIKTALEHNIYYQTFEKPLEISLKLRPRLDLSLIFHFMDLRVFTRDLVKKYQNTLAETSPLYDLIYHDPFSPHQVPHLWTIELFKQYQHLLKQNGRLLTYSRAGAVLGALQTLGYHVYRTPGVGSKNGGTLAALQLLSSEAQACARATALFEEEVDIHYCRKGVPYRDLKNGIQDAKILLQNRLQEQNRI